MSETTTSTATPATTAAPVAAPAAEAPAVAAPTSALATAAKSSAVESVLAQASSAAAASQTDVDAKSAMAKLTVDGVPAPVMQVARDLFAKSGVTPEAAKEVLAGLTKEYQAFRESAEQAELKQTEADWKKALQQNEIFGKDLERNTKIVGEAVDGLLANHFGEEGKKVAKQMRDSGAIGHPGWAMAMLAAERELKRATKQDSVAVGDSQGGAVSEGEKWAQANPKTVAGLRSMGIKV